MFGMFKILNVMELLYKAVNILKVYKRKEGD